LQEVRARNKMRVKTLISKDKIKFLDNFDGTKCDIYRYCCPVCLRYFNHILTSSCCHNYICRLCIGEMAKKAKTSLGYIIRCVHCMTDEFRLSDVNQKDQPKDYTDTPAKFRSRQ
jgi:hypothetical protein